MAWDVERDSILKQLWPTHRAEKVAAHITMATTRTTTKHAVIGRARRLELPAKARGPEPKWSAAANALLKDLWPSMNAHDIAAHITTTTHAPKTTNAVVARARRLGLSGKPGGREKGWTPEQDAILKELWPTHCARDIAARISKATHADTTKNAVISRARRLHLPTKTREQYAIARLAPRAKNNQPHPAKQFPRPSILPPKAATNGLETEADELAPTRTLETLGPRECRFPIDIPGADRFAFCGRPAEKTYCKAHERKAYVPAPGRTNRPPAGLHTRT